MENLILIKTASELDALRNYLSDKDFIAFDTETTGLGKEAEIIGFSVCAEEHIGYYVVLSEWVSETVVSETVCKICEGHAYSYGAYEDENGEILEGERPCPVCGGTGRTEVRTLSGKLHYLETKAKAKDFLQCLTTKSLIMHNAVFDCWQVENNFQVSLMPALHTDTLILAHLLNENRANGLKDLAVSLFGETSNQEQKEMKESVTKNGGVLTKDNYELYKADADLIGRYGAKDAILTLKLFGELVPKLYEEGLDKFFYEDESMPLLRGPTYDLNTEGLRVDPDKLQRLKSTLEAECMDAKAFIDQEIAPMIKAKYPGTSKNKTFNINACKQLAWLLFVEMGNEFNLLTKSGKEVCKFLGLKLPYTRGAKNQFIRACEEAKGQVYAPAAFNYKTKKMSRPKRVADYWHYLACGKTSLAKYAGTYKWVARLLEYKKNDKLLNTYAIGIQSRMQYNIIRPSFLQHGTTSGRYSSKNPNFHNLPRDDKRVNACIVARPGKVLVGADYSQLEPRIFASISGDESLLKCFKDGDDFYSVIGVEVFDKFECSLKKADKNSFANLHPKLRDISKVVALSATYGTTAPKMAPAINKEIGECQDIINNYFERFPDVRAMMLESHEMAKRDGVVYNLFGRPRRIPKARDIPKNVPHDELPYEARNLLNLSVNHRIQSSAASVTNRSSIAICEKRDQLALIDRDWKDVKIVLQKHDELWLEGPIRLADDMAQLLQVSMEQTVLLPGVALIAQPKICNNLADLK